MMLTIAGGIMLVMVAPLILAILAALARIIVPFALFGFVCWIVVLILQSVFV